MTVLERVPFAGLPNQSRIFLDYVRLSPEAVDLYSFPPVLASVKRISLEELRGCDFHRQRLASILRRQNLKFGAAEPTVRHIADLERPDVVAIVTGQQVGLFTGPLYTIYKALAAIRLAARLNSDGIPAVPVFWMDSEDHDLAEITHTTVLGPDSVPRSIDFQPVLFPDDGEKAQPVGAVPLPPQIETAVAQYLAALPDSRYKGELAAELHSAYHAGSTFADAFAQLMTRLFGKFGLILFDPHDAEVKPLVSPVFVRAAAESDAIRGRLLERNRVLDARGFHKQVGVLENSTVLFLEHGGERRALTAHEGGFAVKGTDKVISREELIGIAEQAPHRLSPNVLLRPVVQDFLFPTAAYVAGPAETAYFAQIHVIYEVVGRPMPVIWPRASFTLLEPAVASHLLNYRLTMSDCLIGRDHLVQKMLQAANQASAISVIGDLHRNIDRGIEELRPGLVATDPSLGAALETAKRKVLHQVESLQAKFVHLEARRNTGLAAIADLLLAHYLPNRVLQERQLGVHHFIDRSGPALLDELYRLLQIEDFTHLVLSI